MKWTKDLPKVPGWYWYRGSYDADGNKHVQPVVICVESEGGEDVEMHAWQPFMDYSDKLTAAHFPGEWCGPLEPPQFVSTKLASGTASVIFVGAGGGNTSSEIHAGRGGAAGSGAIPDKKISGQG